MEPTKTELRWIATDPAIPFIGGAAAFLERLRRGDLDTVVSIARGELLNWEQRAATAARGISRIFDTDRDVVAAGIGDLRVINIALMPWTFSYMPDAWRWAVVKLCAQQLDVAWRRLQNRVAQFTPDELTIWQYFVKRCCHPSRWEQLHVLLPLATDNRRAAWNAWNWTSSTPEQTIEQRGFLDGIINALEGAVGAVVDYAEDVYEGAEILAGILGDEYGDAVNAASGWVVKTGERAAIALGFIEETKQWAKRYIPDPKYPSGYRVVIDTINESPLERFGEAIITGVGYVDDAMRREGLGKTARIATMAVATGLAVTTLIVGVAKVATYITGKAAQWLGLGPKPVPIVPTLPPIAPPIPPSIGFEPWMRYTVEGAKLPWLSQININLCLDKAIAGAAGGFKLGALGKLGIIGGAIGLLALAKSYASNVAFALFGLEETMQTDSMTISQAMQRNDPHFAAKKATEQIARYEKVAQQAWYPFVGPLFAFGEYIRTAKENTAKWRDWAIEAIEKKTDAQKRKEDNATPQEAKPIKEKKTKEQKKEEWTADIKEGLIRVFLQLRASRLTVLKHKRLKLGEAYTFDTVNVPLIRSWINRERMEIGKDRDKAQLENRLEEWVAALRESGYPEAIEKTDIEQLLETKYGFKPYKKIGKK